MPGLNGSHQPVMQFPQQPAAPQVPAAGGLPWQQMAQQPVQQPMFAPQSPAPAPQQFQQPGFAAFQPVPPQQQPMVPQQPISPQAAFDIAQWAAQNNLNLDEFGGPEGLLNTLITGVDKAAEYEQQLQQLQQQQQQVAPAQSNWRDHEHMMVRGADGRVSAKPGFEYQVPYQAIADANAEEKRNRETLQSFLANPQEQIQGWLGNDWIEQQVQSRVDQALAAHQRQQSISAFLNENAEWLYQKDPVTGQLTQNHTPHGQRLVDIATNLRSAGHPQETVFDLAVKHLELELLQSQFDMQRQVDQMQVQMQQMQQPGPDGNPYFAPQPQMQRPQPQAPDFNFLAPQMQQAQPPHQPRFPVGHRTAADMQQAYAPPQQQPTNGWQNIGMQSNGAPPPSAMSSDNRTHPPQHAEESGSPDANDIFERVARAEGFATE